jgi:hypothetical protein
VKTVHRWGKLSLNVDIGPGIHEGLRLYEPPAMHPAEIQTLGIISSLLLRTSNLLITNDINTYIIYHSKVFAQIS